MKHDYTILLPREYQIDFEKLGFNKEAMEKIRIEYQQTFPQIKQWINTPIKDSSDGDDGVPKCECGALKVGSQNHYHWCSMYRESNS